jgi:hypothetical protein
MGARYGQNYLALPIGIQPLKLAVALTRGEHPHISHRGGAAGFHAYAGVPVGFVDPHHGQSRKDGKKLPTAHHRRKPFL